MRNLKLNVDELEIGALKNFTRTFVELEKLIGIYTVEKRPKFANSSNFCGTKSKGNKQFCGQITSILICNGMPNAIFAHISHIAEYRKRGF